MNGKPFRVVVPANYSPNSKSPFFGMGPSFKDPSGDTISFLTGPANDPNGTQELIAPMQKGPKNDFQSFVMGPYTVYESSFDLSNAYAHPHGTIPIYPSVAFGVVVLTATKDMTCMVTFNSYGNLVDAKAVVEGACRWIATHN
jgi:hypothetical protein